MSAKNGTSDNSRSLGGHSVYYLHLNPKIFHHLKMKKKQTSLTAHVAQVFQNFTQYCN